MILLPYMLLNLLWSLEVRLRLRSQTRFAFAADLVTDTYPRRGAEIRSVARATIHLVG